MSGWVLEILIEVELGVQRLIWKHTGSNIDPDPGKFFYSDICMVRIDITAVHSSIDGHICWSSISRLGTVYHLPTKGNKLSVFCFRLQQTNGSLLFLLSVCSKQTEIAVLLVLFSIRGIPETWRHEHGDMDMEKTEALAIFFHSFIVCSSCHKSL